MEVKNWRFIGNSEWEDGWSTWECPECGQRIILVNGGPSEFGYKYCPQCAIPLREKLSFDDIIDFLEGEKSILEQNARQNSHKIEAFDQAIAVIQNCHYDEWVSTETRLPNEEVKAYYDKYEEFPAFNVMIKDAIEPTTLVFNGTTWRDELENCEYEVSYWRNMPKPPVRGRIT